MFIDITFAILIGLSFYLGYSKGIIKSFFGIVSIVLAVLITLKFSFLLIGLIEQLLSMDARFSIILGFLMTFLIVMLGVRMIGRGLEKILETAQINFINKLIGGLLSTFITLTLYSSVIWFLNKVKLIDASTKEDSKSYAILESFPEKSRWIWDKTKPIFSEFWDKTQKALDELELKQQEKQPIEGSEL